MKMIARYLVEKGTKISVSRHALLLTYIPSCFNLAYPVD